MDHQNKYFQDFYTQKKHNLLWLVLILVYESFVNKYILQKHPFQMETVLPEMRCV